jgi:tetratricopeptide (TPR) repeat protein
VASILTNLGVVCESRELFDDAVAYHERGLAMFRDLGDRTGEATGLNNLGRAQRRLGRLDEALACQRAGLAITEDLCDRFYRAECLRELGSTWQAAGDLAQARRHWQQAYAAYTDLGVPEADEVAALLSDS